MDSLRRFSNRVENYVKFRPSYPAEILELMRKKMGLRPSHLIADLGSGTGIFSQLLLTNGNVVFAVEPNKEMRAKGESLLGDNPNFKSVKGTAEATTLPDESMDFVTAGQAFHWFDAKKTRKECLRILKPEGKAVLVWNERNPNATPFLAGYEKLLRTLAVDYNEVARLDDQQAEAMKVFFGPKGYRRANFKNYQDFDFVGLKGRLNSSSYAPTETHRNYVPMMEALKKLFDENEKNGVVRFEYETAVYYGEMS